MRLTASATAVLAPKHLEQGCSLAAGAQGVRVGIFGYGWPPGENRRNAAPTTQGPAEQSAGTGRDAVRCGSCSMLGVKGKSSGSLRRQICASLSPFGEQMLPMPVELLLAHPLGLGGARRPLGLIPEESNVGTCINIVDECDRPETPRIFRSHAPVEMDSYLLMLTKPAFFSRVRLCVAAGSSPAR